MKIINIRLKFKYLIIIIVFSNGVIISGIKVSRLRKKLAIGSC